jgi:exonuclease III
MYSWNIRGLNSPLKQHEVVSLMRRNKIDILGLMETKSTASKVTFMHKFRLKNWKFVSNVAVASNARIVIYWNPSTVNVDMLHISAQGIHVLICSLETQISFAATFVYGYNTISARRDLWEDLKQWNHVSPWMILGDFNSILSQEDKYNGNSISNYEVSDFRNCCAELHLAGLNFTGCHFTWSNGTMWSKIDRVMVNSL